jgi:hypothetical protein
MGILCEKGERKRGVRVAATAIVVGMPVLQDPGLPERGRLLGYALKCRVKPQRPGFTRIGPHKWSQADAPHSCKAHPQGLLHDVTKPSWFYCKRNPLVPIRYLLGITRKESGKMPARACNYAVFSQPAITLKSTVQVFMFLFMVYIQICSLHYQS